jgi:glucosamine kinase
MILVADSGSTKTIWAAIDIQSKPHYFQTKGYNPYHISSDEIIRDLMRNLPGGLKPTDVDALHFFGAGCAGDKNCGIIADALHGIFSAAVIEIKSDIHGASLALFGKFPGLACIIGTGSSSAIWNGNDISVTCPSLGYILGDEGSGVSLGIRFLRKFLRRQFSSETHTFFQSNIDLTEDEILSIVYREGNAKKFLASFVPLLNSRLNDPEVMLIIQETFDDFIRVFIKNVSENMDLPIGFCGSPAFYFQEILKGELKNHGLKASKILLHPMDGLVEYFAKGQWVEY